MRRLNKAGNLSGPVGFIKTKKEKTMNTIIDFNRLQDQIKRHEGLRLRVYRDTVGINTIGYGHNLNVQVPANIYAKYNGNLSVITQIDADEIFQVDLLNAIKTARETFSNFDSLPGPKKEALIDMAFNIGNKIKHFKRLIAAIKRYDYYVAAAEMLDSTWANQVGKRAEELAHIIRL